MIWKVIGTVAVVALGWGALSSMVQLYQAGTPDRGWQQKYGGRRSGALSKRSLTSRDR